MCRTFNALIATLEEIVGGEDHEKAVQASGLLLQVLQFSSPSHHLRQNLLMHQEIV